MKNLLSGVLRRLGGALPQLLRPLQIETAQSSSGPARQLERALAAAVKNMGPTASGRIHVINTSEVVARLASQSQKSLDWARERIDTMIRSLVAPTDFLSPFGPDTYVLVARDLSGEEARAHCGLIVREIAERLFGEANDPGIQVSAAVTGQEGDLRYEPVDVSKALAEQIVNAPRHGAPLDRGAAKPKGRRGAGWVEHRRGASGRPSLVPARAPELGELLKRKEGEYGALEEDLRNAREPDADASEKLDGPEWLPGCRSDGEDELEFAEAGIDVRVAYRPVWHAENSVIGTYACHASFHRGAATVSRNEIPELDDPEAMATLDRILLRKALSDLHAAFQAGRQHLAIVPVHPSTIFNSKTRQSYLRLCGIGPEAYRRAIVWEVLAPSLGLLDSQLLPAAATLRPLGRSVILSGELPPLHLHEVAAMGVHAVGLDLAQYSKPEKALIDQLDRLVEYASVHRLRTFVHSCSTVSIATSAVCSGISYLDGEAISAVIDQPGEVTRFGPLDVLKPLLCA